MTERSRQLDLLDTSANGDDFVVRVSPRARHMSIRVTPHRGVEVVVPRRARPGDVHAFVASHRAWIDKTRRELADTVPPPDTSPPAAIALRALDTEYQVRYQPVDPRGRRAGVRTDGSILTVSGAGSDARANALLRHWLKSVARGWLPRTLAKVAESTGLSYERVQVRAQRTRWGSCSSRGTISLNCCLMFLEADEARYLMTHELCHTRHMNHSKAFWRLVASHEPRYRAYEARLDQAWRVIPGWAGPV